LFGRATDAPWGVIFPHGGPLPRHPSQLYEAGLEGLALFIILSLLAHNKSIRAREGFIGGSFLLGYAIFRAFLELFREPDSQLGFLWFGLTMGQILCVPMAGFGLFLILRAREKPAAA
jgi:phosphatidylglycerol---prolipoprotein diacylglyceryl transferase